MFEYAQFVQRNPLYALKNWREQSSVRKVIREKRKATPYCEYCGKTDDLQVHHDVPVWSMPSLADDPENLTTLCRGCHLYVGHLGNYAGTYQIRIKKICRIGLVAKKA